MATYQHTSLTGKELGDLARNYLTLQALLNWDIVVTKANHEKGLDPTVSLQMIIPGAHPTVLHLPASMLTESLQTQAKALATELRESGVNIDELLQEYMETVAPYDQEHKSPLDTSNNLM